MDRRAFMASLGGAALWPLAARAQEAGRVYRLGILIPATRASIEPFFDELLRRSIVEPVLDPDDLSLLLDERLTDGQWDNLTTAVWNLNRQAVSIPFLLAASQKTRRFARR